MTRNVTLPLWLLVLILLFAAVTFASHFLFPSVRWFFRRRAERLVDELNKRLERPIQPFKLARRPDTVLRLVYDPQIMEAATRHAHRSGIREDVAFEEVRRYAREIVPGFSAAAYFGFATRAARWFATRLFTVRLIHRDDGALRRVAPDATVIYVINHRSNMDYVLVTYLVADTAPLSYAVGEWARVWPLNMLIRALGGYFIRRRSRSALYRRVLARYVQMATAGGVTQAVFPEGGLSQDGRLATPKLGLISYIIAEADVLSRDVIFVPVAVNYDRVIEDTLLIEARAKGETRYRGTIPSATAFSLRYLWRRLRGKVHRFGRAAVVFGPPLPLHEVDGAQRDPALAVGAELMRRIRAIMPVLPVPLVALVLAERDRITPADLREEVGRALETLRAHGATLDEVTEPEAAIAEALDALEVRGILRQSADGIEVVEARRGILRFYRASIAHLTDPVATPELPAAAPTP